jgi:hypothetical protein
MLAWLKRCSYSHRLRTDMARSIFTAGGPVPASTSAARWYLSTPCITPLRLSTYAWNSPRNMSVTFLGGKWVGTDDGVGTITECVSAPYITAISGIKASGWLGFALVDVWGAFTSGAWSSSTTIEVRYGGGCATPTCGWSPSGDLSSQPVVAHIGKPCVPYVAACSDPLTANVLTLTVYDDGTAAWA